MLDAQKVKHFCGISYKCKVRMMTLKKCSVDEKKTPP